MKIILLSLAAVSLTACTAQGHAQPAAVHVNTEGETVCAQMSGLTTREQVIDYMLTYHFSKGEATPEATGRKLGTLLVNNCPDTGRRVLGML